MPRLFPRPPRSLARWSLLALVLGGCHFTPPVPVAYVSLGPAHGQPLNPIAAMPVMCGETSLGCQIGYQVMVANTTRMALELGGGSLVDSELINAELRLRTWVSSRPGTLLRPLDSALSSKERKTVAS